MDDDRSAPNTAGEPSRGDTPVARGRLGQRASKSADEAWALELARIRAMTPRERMIRALALAEETRAILARIGRVQG